MEDVKFYTRRSAWTMFRYLFFWITFLLDIVCVVLMLTVKTDDEKMLFFICFGFFIISVLIFTICYLYATCEKYYFYKDHVTIRKKFFTVKEVNIAMLGIMEVNVYQNFLQRILNFGTISIDYYGQYSIDKKPLVGVAKPKKLKAFLTTQIQMNKNINKIIVP